MKTKKSENGFTLVELIVVLVVLAILLAVLVPALTGYIEKGRQQQAMQECRAAVQAAQTLAIERYAAGALTSDTALQNDADFARIAALAEVEQSKLVRVTVNAAKGEIARLEYRFNAELLVVYDASASPAYQLAGDQTAQNSLMQTAQSCLEQISGNNALTGANKTKALQSAFAEVYAGGYPALTAEEQKLLTEKGMAEETAAGLDWRPIATADGTVILAAADKTKTSSAPMTYLIYWEGQYYYHVNGYTTKPDSNWVSDAAFCTDTLREDAKKTKDPRWVLLS